MCLKNVLSIVGFGFMHLFGFVEGLFFRLKAWLPYFMPGFSARKFESATKKRCCYLKVRH